MAEKNTGKSKKKLNGKSGKKVNGIQTQSKSVAGEISTLNKKISGLERDLREIGEKIRSSSDVVMIEGLEHIGLSEEIKKLYSLLGISSKKKVSELMNFLEKLKKDFESGNYDKKLNYLYVTIKNVEKTLEDFSAMKEKFERSVKSIEALEFEKDNISSMKTSIKEIYGKLYILRDRIEALKSAISHPGEQISKKIEPKELENIKYEILQRERAFEEDLMERFKKFEFEMERKIKDSITKITELKVECKKELENFKNYEKKINSLISSIDSYEASISDEIQKLRDYIENSKVNILEACEKLIENKLPGERISDHRIRRIEEEIMRGERRLAKVIQAFSDLNGKFAQLSQEVKNFKKAELNI